MFMLTYKRLAEKFINLTDIDWNGRDEQRNTCVYGLEMLIAFVVNCMLLLLAGIVTGQMKEIMIYTFAWGSLRLFAGGGHARNHLYCIVYFVAVMYLVIKISGYLAVSENVEVIILLFMLAGFVMNWAFAGKQKESPEDTMKYKKRALMVWAIEYLVIVFILKNYAREMELFYELVIFSGAVVAESLFLLPVKGIIRSRKSVQFWKFY